jgi:3-hydroxyacyl-CoA dehydrogenase
MSTLPVADASSERVTAGKVHPATTVTLANEGRVRVLLVSNPPLNVLSQAVRRDLLNEIRAAGDDPAVDSIVILCDGKTFISGADLAEFDTGFGEPGYHVVFNSIEHTKKPVVVALHGTVLGAGVELAIACHYRIGLAGTKLGMPEITLGVVPGAGGTQRLPRLTGAARALDLLLTGKPVDAANALQIGLIDEVVPSDLRKHAVAAAARLAGSSEAPRRTGSLPVRDAQGSAFADAEELAHTTLRGRTTPALMIEAVQAAVTLPIDQGLERETAISNSSLEQIESRALRHLFFAERQTSKIPGLAPNLTARNVERVAIIGSGTMGGGIAMSFADAGLPVTLLDVDQIAVERGLERIRANYQASVARGRMSAADADRRLSLIRTTSDYADLRTADLIIEAVIEDMGLKRRIFALLDDAAGPHAILATNTSTLDINEIAAATRRPQDVVGLHFFSPANVMRLLEIVRADKTADDVLATAFAVAKRLRKTGVLSRVCYGFIGNRMMDPYAREAERMVLEGATPQQVDGALEAFGMAMGILAVFDMAGVDVGVLIRKERGALLPPDPSYYRCSALLFEHGWLGQKSGKGFYRYQGRERLEHPEAIDLFRAEARRLSIAQKAPDATEIERRCLFALVNEGARILEEGVALRSSDIDVVYTSGYGFPRHRGGPMFWADTIGLDQVLNGIETFAAQFGPMHWQPAPLLVDLVRSGKKFRDI